MNRLVEDINKLSDEQRIELFKELGVAEIPKCRWYWEKKGTCSYISIAQCGCKENQRECGVYEEEKPITPQPEEE